MRPRKRVIIYSKNLEWADSVRFALETRMPVTCAETDDPEVVKVLATTMQYGCLVILAHRASEARKSVAMCHLPMVSVTERARRENDAMLSLMDAVRYKLKRKTGPKPKVMTCTAAQ